MAASFAAVQRFKGVWIGDLWEHLNKWFAVWFVDSQRQFTSSYDKITLTERERESFSREISEGRSSTTTLTSVSKNFCVNSRNCFLNSNVFISRWQSHRITLYLPCIIRIYCDCFNMNRMAEIPALYKLSKIQWFFTDSILTSS